MQNYKASEGKAQAETIISKFYRVRPEDGMIEEKDHYLEGRIIARKVLLFPSGKGSAVAQQDGLYHLDCFYNMPSALILQAPRSRAGRRRDHYGDPYGQPPAGGALRRRQGRRHNARQCRRVLRRNCRITDIDKRSENGKFRFQTFFYFGAYLIKKPSALYIWTGGLSTHNTLHTCPLLFSHSCG